MTHTINDLTNIAIERWANLIGIDAKGRIKKGVRNPWSEWDLREHTEKLNESRTLDPTGLTTFMMLRGIVERYLKEVQFSAFDLILDPKSIAQQLVPMKGLKDVLEAPQVLQLITDFQTQLRGAATEYGVRPGKPMDALENLLEDKFDLAYIRKDALVSIHNLETHQFIQGTSDGQPAKFVPKIYEFWNINSLLQAMRSQRVSGISMCLIRDPDEALHSYFVFAVRNGTTITILTDREKTAHPAQNRMSRRPDRTLSRRAARNWFPYHLVGLKEAKDETGEVKRIYAERRTQLVPINVEAVALKDIRDLEAEEFVWATLMFDLIRDKFWVQDFRVPELSYTGEMIVAPQALVGSTGSLVKEGLYKPLELPLLTREDVTAEKTKKQWDRKPTGFNRWMVERYGGKVPEEVFNPVGPEAKLLLEAKAEELLPVVHQADQWGQSLTPSFETMSAITFGTKEQIQKDRVWVARMNQMTAIQRLADDEFQQQRETICDWYRAHVRRNLPALLDASARGELILPHWLPARFGGGDGTSRTEDRNALEQKVGNRWYKVFSGIYSMPEFRFGYYEARTGEAYCAEREDTMATVFTIIRPTCPEALAVLAGVKVEDLPWALQHWYNDDPYHGNSILDRLDPEDWRLHNPWMHSNRRSGVSFKVWISHSKQALHARRKALGLPRKEFVPSKRDD